MADLLPNPANPASSVTPYEDRLRADLRWGMGDASIHFEGKGSVQAALRKIARHLDELGISYAIAGAMAMFIHGFRRFTVDVDVLISEEDQKALYARADVLGYVADVPGGKNLRVFESGVRIKFLIVGQSPGCGELKPVCFPDPKSVVVERDGIKYLSLPALIEIELAWSIDNPTRLRGVADTQEIIKTLDLPREFAVQLHPYVRDKFLELWDIWKNSPPDPHEFGTMDDL